MYVRGPKTWLATGQGGQGSSRPIRRLWHFSPTLSWGYSPFIVSLKLTMV